MSEISAALVKELREETNVGMMECKKALLEAKGDKETAVRILRERGMAVAEKKASRAANQGIIASCITDEGRVGSLIEINCETDFVAKNDGFKSFASDMAKRAAGTDGSLADEAKQNIVAQIAEIGENVIVRRNIRYMLQGSGVIASYIHHGSTLGVLVEMGCEKVESTSSSVLVETARDICLHIAASNPKYIDETGVPADVTASEREIFAKQVENKPPQIVEKIVDGKMNKFHEQVCLIYQPFVKDQEKTVLSVLKERADELKDVFTIRRFTRFQVGETI